MRHITKKIFKDPRVIFVFIFLVCCILYPCYKAEIAKEVYRKDIDIQYKQMYKYTIVPLKGTIQDRLGGYYSFKLYYEELSDDQLDILADELMSDGFSLWSDSGKNRVYCKDKIAVEVYRDKENGQIRILLRRNDYTVR